MSESQQFKLLKGISNNLALSERDLFKLSVDEGLSRLSSVINLSLSGQKYLKLLGSKGIVTEIQNKKVAVVLLDYPLISSYNERTGHIVLNLKPLGAETITATKPLSYTLFAALLSGLTLKNFANSKLTKNSLPVLDVVSFMFSLYIGVFSKKFGLTVYREKMQMLSFLLSIFIGQSFFSYTFKKALNMAYVNSSIQYDRKLEEQVSQFDFTSILDFIKSLNYMGALNGITISFFMQTFYKYFGLEFLPALENLSRFVSFLASSTITSNGVYATFLYKYNIDSFNNIIESASKVLR